MFDRCGSVACFLTGLDFAGYAKDFMSGKEWGDPDGSELEPIYSFLNRFY